MLPRIRDTTTIIRYSFKMMYRTHSRNSIATRAIQNAYNMSVQEMTFYLESIGSLIYDMRRSFTVADVINSFATFYRQVVGKSVVGTLADLFSELATSLGSHLPFMQSTDWIDVFDGLYKNVHKVKGSILGTKLITVLNHVIAHSVYHKMGIEVDTEVFRKLEKKVIRPTVWNCVSFADAIAGLLLFLAKAGRQAIMTGNIDCFFVDSDVVSAWLAKANKLRKDAEFLGNPQAVGIELPTYLAEIQSHIEDGSRMAPVFKGIQKSLIQAALLELQLVEKRHISSLAAASFRFCPVGINLFGESGVGKAFIGQGLFYHYCSVRGIPKTMSVLFPRNPDDKYYSGYKSYHMGVMYDDVGKHKSNKVMGIDLSLTDLISAINNTSMITNQAEACDKGKVPFLSEWVGVTSNMEHLNVHDYYNNTYAVLRRLPYRIEPIVKDEFRIAGTTKLDSTKVPQGEQYPDCWRFRVCGVIQNDAQPLHGMYEDRNAGKLYESFADLLVWLTEFYQSHINIQTQLLATVNAAGPEVLCKCKLPVSLCRCEDPNATPFLFGPQEYAQNLLEGDAAQDLIDSVLNDDMLAKMEEFHKARTQCAARHKLEGTALLFFRKWWSNDSMRNEMFDALNIPDKTLQHYFVRVFEHELAEFENMSPQGKAYKLSKFQLPAGEEYLTFTPVKNGRRNFLRSQMQQVYKMVLPYVDFAKWSDKQKAALELFIYEKAPRCLAEGWDDPSIIQAAIDYVDMYADALVPEELRNARDLLRAADQTTWTDRMCREAGFIYFSNPTVKTIVDWCVWTPPIQFALSRYRGSFHRGGLEGSAQRRDLALGGGLDMVKMLKALCLCGGVALLIRMAMKLLPTATQVSVHEIGKKPEVRETEKKNIWKTEERMITKLDFSSRRMTSLKQLAKPLAHNSLRVEIRADTDKGRATATTRVLVVDNNTIVMNSHACWDNMKMTLFLVGKRPEGVCPTVEITVVPEMVTRDDTRDLAFIRTLSLPATFKEIRHNFPKRSNNAVGESYYHIPQEDGSVKEVPVYGVRKHRLTAMQGGRPGLNVVAWAGRPDQKTESGDCGSPLVVVTAYGPIIAGIHCSYDPYVGSSFATPLFYEDFDHAPMVTVGEITPASTIAQADVVPLKKEDKLYTDYHATGTLFTHGQLKGFRARPKAKGGFTEIATFVLEHGRDFGLNPVDRLGLPDMGSWEPQQNILVEYLTPTHSINEYEFMCCVETFVMHLEDGLSKEDRADIHPVPMRVAVNGFPGVPNVDAQKFTTSAGHGRRGPKIAYVALTHSFEEWDTCREYSPEVEQEVQDIVDKAYLGIRSHPIFTAQLKNEMVSHKKIAIKKTRGFYMCPVAYLTAMRVFTTGLTRVMVRRNILFRNAVGLNTHSDEWNNVFLESEKIAGNNWMAGDFKGFDKILSILIQNGAKKVLLDIVRSSGFTDEEVLALDTLLCDTVSATIDFFGELVTLLGGEVSGHQITTFFNSICNVLLHQYAFVHLAKIHEECDPISAGIAFFKEVFISVLGDDIMAKVSRHVPWYNHTSVQQVFAEIGIEYTMADKTSESRPYISLEEVTFLKRTFREHVAFPGCKVAPLEMDSIYKMLVYTIPSNSVSKQEQLAMAITSAVTEAFYHGKEVFDAVTALISAAPKSPELVARMEQFPAPTWYQMVERFYAASPNYRVLLGTPGVYSESHQDLMHSHCPSTGPECQMKWSVDAWGSTTMGRSPEDRVYEGVRLSSKEFLQRRRKVDTAVAEDSLLTKNYRKETHIGSAEGQMAPAETESAIRNFRIKRYRRNKQQKWLDRAICQMDVSFDAGATPKMEGQNDIRQQTTLFKNEPIHKTVDLGQTPTTLAMNMNMPQGIAEYFQRPLLINTFTWLESMGVDRAATFNPWSLYLGSAAMKNKLQGFSLARGNLHLKFVVNGSPFYYGALMATYTPLSGYRPDTAYLSTAINASLVAQSQKPHVWLNVQDTSSAEMVLPFLYPYPYVETQVLSRLADLGQIQYWVYYVLQSANGVTGSAVDVQVFAWMDDIQLAGPTDQAVAQADVEYQDDHQLSQMASTVADVAGKLKFVPGIGEYAMATEAAARAASGVASFFGYTNVPNVSDVQPVKQVPFSLASAEISEPITKLSLQPKQETAIGAVQHGGLEDDELAIQRFAGRNSFLVGSTWLTSQTPGSVLFTTAVIPLMAQVSGSTTVAHTPMSYAAQHFQYWRGGIEFTFKVIRSPYHRGRLQIGWDRGAINWNQSPILGNANTYNVIMDLDETDEVTMKVPYSQAKQFLSMYNQGGNPFIAWSTSPTPSGSWNRSNGILSVRVMNRLTAPESSSNAGLFVFVRACDDFELAGPVEWNTMQSSGTNTVDILGLSTLTTSVVQSQVVYDDNVAADDLMTSADDPDVYKELFGEKILSFRELLHRSSLAKTITFANPSATTASVTLKCPIKRMPPAPGCYNNGWDVGTINASAGQRVNYAHFHPLVSIGGCFVGYKGSVNVTANFSASGLWGNSGYADSIVARRLPYGTVLSAASRRPSMTAIDTTVSAQVITLNKNNLINSGAEGQTLTNARTNTGLSANLPYYANAGFQLSNMYNEYNNQDTLCDNNSDWWQIEATFDKSNASTNAGNSTFLDLFYASGPDFDFVFFINVPLLTITTITAV